MRFYNSIVLAAIIAVVFAAAVEAQTRKKTLTTTKKPAASAIAPAPVPEKLVEPAVVRSEPKRNERPSTTSSSVPVNSAPAKTDATYFYEFKQPEFTISRIVIEHDD